MKKYSTFNLLSDLWKYIRPYRGRFIFGSFLRLTADVAWLFPAYALSETITFLSHYRSGDSTDYLQKLFFIWILLSCVRYWGNQWSKSYLYQIAEKGGLDLATNIMSRLLRADTAWHEKENSGNKLKRIQQGAAGVDRLIRIWANNIIEITVNLVGMTIILIHRAPGVGLVFAGFIVINFTLSRLLTPRAVRAAKIAADLEENYTGLAFEAVSNVRTVKVVYAQDELLKRLKESSKELFSAIRTRIIRFRQREVIIQTISQGFRLGGGIFIVLGILKGRFEVGMFALYYSYFNAVWQSVDELSNTAQDMVVSKLALGRVRELLLAPSMELEDRTLSGFPKKWESIEFENVTFGYGETTTLKNVSFTVARGEKVGIVGLSGAGKSTLFKLLLKEYENFTGNISIGGTPVTEIAHRDYFKHVAVVLQDTEVFNFSLEDNITIGNNKKTSSKQILARALETSHVQHFLHKLPEGVHTLIGEKGIKLSGGERQRLGIARAIYKEPSILLLDEATSHLDVESEKDIQESLHDFFQNVTAIVIAHRLSTLREMDKIVVLEGGTIVEQGSFAELLKRHGRFYELWEKQKI